MDHYENFPVASWLCPPRLRPAVSAIYRFARSADDIADEGDAPASRRLADLLAYRADLHAVASDASHSGRWPQVFAPLQAVLRRFDLPVAQLDQLLDAFEQDVRFTAQGRRYQNNAELLDYCQRSANPVGRLLLHLYDVQDTLSLAQSDKICSALQLINFWQDLSVDIARARWYPSLQAMQSHALQDADLLPGSVSANASRLVADYVHEARALMTAGAPLARRIPGRAGWELRLVVQGGLLIADKIEALNFQSWRHRPTLGAADLPLLLWRTWHMS